MAEKTETKTNAATPAKKPWADQPKPTKDQLVRVSVRGGAKDGYRCVGRAFTNAHQDFAFDTFSQEELWKLAHNPYIAMYFVAAPEEKAKS